MKLCMPHWNELKQAIEDRGLAKYVSSSGEIAIKKMQNQITPGTSKQDGWDPLMNANFAIWANCIDAGGLYLMGAKEDGTDYCPLCELTDHGGNASQWIGFAADEQVGRAKELGYLPNKVM